MIWKLESAACAAAWPVLLELREVLRGEAAAGDRASLELEDGGWRLRRGGRERDAANGRPRIDLDLRGGAAAPESWTSDGAAAPSGSGTLLAPLRLYLPLLLGAAAARRAGRVFVTAHLAQSLDGRIACGNGLSQWIGNEANLHHAHRLRALHDAVLVGRRTVEIDDPRLTVRHVAGPDPVRVVLGGGDGPARGDGDARGFRVFDGAGATLVRRTGSDGPPPQGRVDLVALPAAAGGRIRPADVCAALRKRGLASVFVEGGGQTLSAFVEHDAIDVLHLHLAGLILGSGIDSFRLPEIASIAEGRRFRIEAFQLDGEILLECRPRHPA